MIIPEAGSSARLEESGGSSYESQHPSVRSKGSYGSPYESQGPSARSEGSGASSCESQRPSGTRWKKAETMLSDLLLRRLQILSPILRKRNSSLNDTSGGQVGQEPAT